MQTGPAMFACFGIRPGRLPKTGGFRGQQSKTGRKPVIGDGRHFRKSGSKTAANTGPIFDIQSATLAGENRPPPFKGRFSIAPLLRPWRREGQREVKQLRTNEG
jgi:hypothetical protein